jgi:hypothetical protein
MIVDERLDPPAWRVLVVLSVWLTKSWAERRDPKALSRKTPPGIFPGW